jgi:uncharacterized protein (UPF0548 family)
MARGIRGTTRDKQHYHDWIQEMNREQTKHATEIMLQWANDPDVKLEYKYKRGEDTWKAAVIPVWDWEACDYRIKPKPAEFWAIINETTGNIVVTSKDKTVVLVYVNLDKKNKFRVVKLTETPE